MRRELVPSVSNVTHAVMPDKLKFLIPPVIAHAVFAAMVLLSATGPDQVCAAEPSPFPLRPAGSSFTAKSPLTLHVPSPDWRDQIIYFLVTDRFNDGDPSNNDLAAGECAGHFLTIL